MNIKYDNVFNFNYKSDIFNLIDNIAKNRVPSKEKIWNRSYTNEQLNAEFPKMTKMDYIRSKHINSNLVALEYFGKTSTYGELDKVAIEYAEKLVTLNVSEGDSIALCLPNTPELIKLMCAIDECGAICNNIFPICTAKEIEYCVNTLQSKILFVLDSNMKLVDSVLENTSLEKVIYVTPFESLPVLKIPYDVSQKLKGFRPKNKKYQSFNDFLKTKGTKFTKPKYVENRISSIQYTSGTTGSPKPVILTDDTYNARAYQYEQLEVGITGGGRFLHCIPACGKAFGEFTIHLGLTNGLCNVLVPKFTTDDLIDMFKKYHIQGMSMTPIGWLHIIESPVFENIDLNDFMLASMGGDGAIEKMVKLIQDSLQRKGFKGNAILGSGATELGVTFSTNTAVSNKMGSSGKLLLGNTVKIINEDGEECSYNENGTIYYNAVYQSVGYLNNMKLNKTEYGIDLGDYGYIDDEGNLTVLCRKNQLILINGKYYCPTTLEIAINKCLFVKYGYVVEPQNSKYKVRVCYTTYENCDNKINNDELLDYLPDEIKEYTEIHRIKEIPQAGGLKVDKEKLSLNIDDLLVN